MRKVSAILFLLALPLLVSVPAIAEDSIDGSPVILTAEDISAAIEATCACSVEEELAAAEDDGLPEDELNEEPKLVPPGRCISQISKLRQSLKNLAFFGLVDEEIEAKTLVQTERLACKKAAVAKRKTATAAKRVQQAGRE